MYKFKTEHGQEAGLRVWVAFILGFWLAGFRAELCIFLGALGGLATWYLVSAWRAEKADPKPAAPPAAPPPLSPLGKVFRQPAERFRKLGLSQRLPKIPELPKMPIRERKPRRRL
ncbi:MAG: hypothetical protein KME07_08300 [Pegethrix bostrychoides GSE-TBD4-15B]|uniref:Uncharacterized protein n=1 Tax=Pegethrix bostrychoides GSE-TBD4-15B TaxID=2839662 RepID=A0A951P9I5_9CYAN|nr:hypothetical protein [Pegethrix bostrychoides GSE-TBD4-15B]